MKWFRRFQVLGVAASAVFWWNEGSAQNYYPSSYSQPTYPQPAYPTHFVPNSTPYYPANFRQPNATQVPTSNPMNPGALPGPGNRQPIPLPIQNSVPNIPPGTSSILNPQANPETIAPGTNGLPNVPQQYPVAPSHPVPYESQYAPMPSAPGHAGPQYAPAPNYAPAPQYSHAPQYPTAHPQPSSTTTLVPPMSCGFDGYGGDCRAPSAALNVDYFEGGPANNGWFFVSDLVLWSFNQPSIHEFGDPGSEGLVTVNNITYPFYNSLDSRWVDSSFRLGPRFEFGKICDGRGWMAGIMNIRYGQSYSATNVNYVFDDPFGLSLGYAADGNHDADIDGDHIYGRDGVDLGTPDPNNPGSFIAPFDGDIDAAAPVDTDDLLSWLATFSSVRATSLLQLTGFELSDVHRSESSDWCSSWDWFWGLRYLRVRDQYGVFATGGIYGDTGYTATSDNDIIGPQLGARWLKHNGWVGLSLEGRFLAGYNHQQNNLSGFNATNIQIGQRNQPVALTPNSYLLGYNNSEFSPVGELRANVSWSINRWLALHVGYTGLVIGNVSRANEKVHFALPNNTLTNTANRETIFGSGINLGLEINR